MYKFQATLDRASGVGLQRQSVGLQLREVEAGLQRLHGFGHQLLADHQLVEGVVDGRPGAGRALLQVQILAGWVQRQPDPKAPRCLSPPGTTWPRSPRRR
jgi:hypothetical protein